MGHCIFRYGLWTLARSLLHQWQISSSVTAGMYSLEASAQQSRQQGATVQLSHGTALFILPLKVDAKHLEHLKLGLDL